MLLGMAIGPLADKGKRIYGLMFFVNTALIAGGALIITDIYLYESHSISKLFYAGYMITGSMYPLTNLLSITLLSKIVDSEKRGTVFAVNGLLGSIGVTAMQAVAQATFDGNNKIIFILAYSCSVFINLLIMILCMMGKKS